MTLYVVFCLGHSIQARLLNLSQEELVERTCNQCNSNTCLRKFWIFRDKIPHYFFFRFGSVDIETMSTMQVPLEFELPSELLFPSSGEPVKLVHVATVEHEGINRDWGHYVAHVSDFERFYKIDDDKVAESPGNDFKLVFYSVYRRFDEAPVSLEYPPHLRVLVEEEGQRLMESDRS
jgi:hypothetical protein